MYDRDQLERVWRTLFFITLIGLLGLCHKPGTAEDLSTWRYGSPSDFRIQSNRASQRDYSPGYPGYPPGDDAAATALDTMFRAGSPELYIKTMRPPANVHITVTNNNSETPSAIRGPAKRPVSGRRPEYPY